MNDYLPSICDFCERPVFLARCCGRLVTASRMDPHCDASETGRHVLRTYA
jgi:hypothetical protein